MDAGADWWAHWERLAFRIAATIAVTLTAICAWAGDSAATPSARAVASAARPRACTRLKLKVVESTLLDKATDGIVLDDTAVTCTWASPQTGAEAELDIYTVGAGNRLPAQKNASIAGDLDCTTARLAQVKGKGGELGYYCPSSWTLAIEQGSVLLDLRGSANTTGSGALGDANVVLAELHAK